MKISHLIAPVVMLGSLLTAPAYALDFKAVGAAPAILYDAPSETGRRVFVAPRGMPVDVVLTYGDWSKVRDAAGTLSWIMSKSLVAKRNVVVTATNARIHATADESSTTVFSADKNVLLELVDPSVVSGWIKVKHRDGQGGYATASEVWGD